MKPAYTRISPVNIKGVPTQRLMIVFITKGCEYARKTGGCTVCGFLNNAVEDISEDRIISQLDYVLADMDLTDVGEIDLLTLGSFYNDAEVSPGVRAEILDRVATIPSIQRVSFESRGEYVTEKKLRESKKILNGKIMEFGIGLESADDFVRNRIIKKGLSAHRFRKVVETVGEVGGDLLVYLLIKPPGLSEQEAIEDAVKSVEFVARTASHFGVDWRAAFEPVFICQNTELERLYIKAEYRLVNLWSVVEVIKRTHHLGCIFVGLSDEELSLDRMPHSCDDCYGHIVREIELFNRTQEISGLSRLDCRCRREYENQLYRGVI